MTEQSVTIGDSVLAPQGGNLVPGVVLEVQGDRVLVELAQPYVDETHASQSQIWAPLSEVQKVLDDADAPDQLTP